MVEDQGIAGETNTYVSGVVVETSYGVGVIVRCPKDDEEKAEKEGKEGNEDSGAGSPTFHVALWRHPGKSVSSCSIAYLQPEAILRRLPVAPGMVTTKKTDDSNERYMIQSYYSSQQQFWVTRFTEDDPEPIDLEQSTDPNESVLTDDLEEQETLTASRLSGLAFTGKMFNSRNLPPGGHFMEPADDGELVSVADLSVASSAKFYPLLFELMRRGDRTAAATKEFLHQKEVSNVIEKATKFTQQQTEQAMEQAMAKAKTVNPDEAVDSLATKVKDVVNEDEVQHLMSMIKNEDLTVLLEKGKERLEQLLQKDIPKATEQALQTTGIRIALDDAQSESPYMTAIKQSREVALKAMDEVLKQAQVDPNDLEAIRGTLQENFVTMFDNLSDAAKSDRTLANIMDTMSQHTAEWQEATGRLMSTRSASLFMEGASRIQARAKNLFSKDQLQWAGEIGSKLTKAFTEGDAAVARLKSIELGDKVRNRLVQAIEVRSESLGGLDGIIAGALTTMKGTGRIGGGDKSEGDQMQDMLTNLQSRATTVTKDTHETLISVLARQSEYRDVALLKVEQVMCDLESQFGDDLSPEDIAAVARGEGGTAKLFEPIAKRAAKEIEKQLDVAEASVSDSTMLDVLKHVRKIVSGELTMQAVLDEVVNILNDDKVVAAGENLVKQGEQVLDAIEGVSGNKVVDDVMQIAERAGITKDTVMEGIENLDVNELLDNAGNAITDERARRKLLSDATDTALDFILRILPSMPVPPFDGVNDGLVYHISNLSMEGFKVKKENILVQIAGMRATKKAKPGTKVEVLDSGDTKDDASDIESKSNVSSARSRTASSGSIDTFEMDYDTEVGENVVVKATELLIIDVREISAIFNDAKWGFEQTYLPYLRGNGKFDVKMSDGAIRLVFELRKRNKEKEDGTTAWEPVLCLHDRSCSIGSVDFTMQGGSRLAWVINKVASAFKGLLRDYVVRTIMRILTDKSGWILSQLNKGLSPFWDVLLRTAKLKLDDLEEAGQEDIVANEPVEQSNYVELVWRDRIPLGMNLLLNDESGQLKVVDFPRGSQARTVCEKRNLDPDLFKGAAIVAVNGIRHQNDDDLFEALRDPARPKTVSFELAESEDAERIRKFVEESKDGPKNPPKPEQTSNKERAFATRRIEFTDPGELGIEFANPLDNYGLIVRKFLERDDGVVLAAARKDGIHEGDLLTHINGKLVVGADGKGRVAALKLLEAEGNNRPLHLNFADPYLYRAVYEKSNSLPVSIGGPAEIEMVETKLPPPNDTKRIAVKGFKNVDGVSEKSGILLGDYLVFINGMAVGAGCRWLGETSAPGLMQVHQMLRNTDNYPIGLTFARPTRVTSSRDWLGAASASQHATISMDESERICVTAETYEQLGLVLDIQGFADVTVKDLDAVPGPFQVASKGFLQDKQTKRYDHLSVEAVNGEFVPSFATPQMVRSAMDRSWKSEGRVEIIFCDDERKSWIQSLKEEK